MVITEPRTLTVGTRTSRLARWQTDHIVKLLEAAWPKLRCEIRPFVTKGDKTLNKPLPEIGGKGLFTAELESALREGEIDIAVHSLKDLPVQNAPGLTLGAIVGRADVHDGLVARDKATLETLPEGAVVGTSSLRRQAQLLAQRPDLKVKSIRGNVGTRVRKALEGDYDASVMAAAGLQRLDMADVITQWLPLDVMLPAPGQGALGVQCRADDEQTLACLAAINDEMVRAATAAERHFLQALGGGCSAPIAAYATATGENGELHMRALIASPDGQQIIRVAGNGTDPRQLGERLAEAAKTQGANAILEEVEMNRPVQLTAAPSPLAGKRVVVTRPEPQAPELAEPLQSLGATPILFPTIAIRPLVETGPLDEAIERLAKGAYDWVIFTSVNGVALFWERLEALGKNVLIFDGVQVAAIGPATGTALSQNGVEADYIPEEFVAEAIAEGLGDVSGRSILLPRAAIARKTLAEMLTEQGAEVDEVATYRTLPAEPDETAVAELATADIFTFTSSSTVRNFVKLVGGKEAALRLTQGARIACIGPITAGTVAEMGRTADIVAETYTIDGLVAALVDGGG